MNTSLDEMTEALARVKDTDTLFAALIGANDADDLPMFLVIFSVLLKKATLADIVRELDMRLEARRALRVAAENAQNGGTR